MGFLGDIFSGAASGTIKGTFEGIGSLAKDIRSAITGEISPEKKAELEQKILEMESLANQGQNAINLVEASNPNLFVSGARPFILWVCGFALLYQFVGFSLLQWVATIWGFAAPPTLETGGLVTILLSLLGLGGLRTLEKAQGTQSNHG